MILIKNTWQRLVWANLSISKVSAFKKHFLKRNVVKPVSLALLLTFNNLLNAFFNENVFATNFLMISYVSS